MSNIRKFSKDHLWVEMNGEKAKIGISDYAQSKLGAIVFLNLPEEGDELEIGEQFGDVESIKTVSELISPVKGNVEAVNEALMDELEAIAEKPYESWLVEATVEEIREDLMDEAAYAEYVESL